MRDSTKEFLYAIFFALGGGWSFHTQFAKGAVIGLACVPLWEGFRLLVDEYFKNGDEYFKKRKGR